MTLIAAGYSKSRIRPGPGSPWLTPRAVSRSPGGIDRRRRCHRPEQRAGALLRRPLGAWPRRRSHCVAGRAGGDRGRVSGSRISWPAPGPRSSSRTTNRTHLTDYESAVTERTRLLLKVAPLGISGHRLHRRSLTPRRIAGVGAPQPRRREPCTTSGSGLLTDLSPWGLRRRATWPRRLASGVDAVAFSGDKLLGGPQAGILLGTREAIAACRKDPLAASGAPPTSSRSLPWRPRWHCTGNRRQTGREFLVIRMLTEDVTEIRRRGEALQKGVGKEAELIEGRIRGWRGSSRALS